MLRAGLDAIVRATLAAVDARSLVRAALSIDGTHLRRSGQTLDLAPFARVLVIAAGKASVPMARGCIDVLGERVSDGVVVAKASAAMRVGPLAVLCAGHPLPDAASVEAGRRVRAVLEDATERDLVLLLLSGGASSLVCDPPPDVSLADLRATMAALQTAGADIHALNAVRKHLDDLKGGMLARVAERATLLALVLSDVPGDDLAVIASGPTVPDPTTFTDARDALVHHGVWTATPASVRERFERGVRGEISDTPKPGDACFARVRTGLVGSSRDAVQGASEVLRRLGHEVATDTAAFIGDAREVGRVFGERLSALSATESAPRAFVAGGETTVRVTGGGVGGRTLELALAAALAIDSVTDVALLVLATDGDDGPTGAAGAVVRGDTIARAKVLGLDAVQALARNDTLPFFTALGDLVVTGPTGTNVGDVVVGIAGRATSERGD